MSVSRGALPAGRRAHILSALERDGLVRISDLSADLGVSPVTLRRDLAQFEEEGLLERVHGGAVPVAGRALASAPTTRPKTRDGAPSLAVLVPSLDYYWPGVIRGMEAAAERHGMRLLLRGSSYELIDERPVLERLVHSEQVEGLVFAPNVDSPYAADVAEWLSAQDLPVVLVERDVERRAARHVELDPSQLGTPHAAEHRVVQGPRGNMGVDVRGPRQADGRRPVERDDLRATRDEGHRARDEEAGQRAGLRPLAVPGDEAPDVPDQHLAVDQPRRPTPPAQAGDLVGLVQVEGQAVRQHVDGGCAVLAAGGLRGAADERDVVPTALHHP